MSNDPHPWPPDSAGWLSRLYNAEFSRIACNLGFDNDEAHEQACKRIQETGRPPPLLVSTASHDYHTGLSRTEICEALAMETIRRAVYEGAIRRIFEVVGDVGLKTEDDPAQAALTEVYNLCNTAIPGLNGDIPEPEEDDGIAADQEKLRRIPRLTARRARRRSPLLLPPQQGPGGTGRQALQGSSDLERTGFPRA